MVGLLTVTHNRIGRELRETARQMLGELPLAWQLLEVGPNSDPEALTADGERLITELDHGDGVLVLTDLYGSTPSNIANRLRRTGRVEVVSGISLPMVIRLLNYATLDLEQLAEKALSGGQDGTRRCNDTTPRS